jgi:NADH dehydrogenase
MTPKKIAVTGAFGYSGKYITRKLLAQGHEVITLTNHPDRPNPFGDQVKIYPFNFDQPEKLEKTLEGADVLINTYWVRFNHGNSTFHRAISNIRTLFRAAKQAKVQRVVHISITNPDPCSPLNYFWGKAILEQDLKATNISCAILRPAVIFGQEDILINNIAWILRRFPAFAIPGDGGYQLQPIFVEDLAELAVSMAMSTEDTTIDAIGPETYTFKELVEMIKTTLNAKSLLFHLNPSLTYWASSVIGRFVGDVVLTREEVIGLMDNLLVTDSPPSGETKLSEWVDKNKETLGKHYANEIKRHFVVNQ